MSEQVNEIKQMIIRQVTALAGTEQFTEWFGDHKAKNGDLVIINNSFIYRKPLVTTSKNSQYLGLPISDSTVDPPGVLVAEPGDIDSDFKLYKPGTADFRLVAPLDDAIDKELSRLGRLVFVLVGTLEQPAAEVRVDDPPVRVLRFDPASMAPAVVAHWDHDNGAITVNELTDFRSVWDTVKGELEAYPGVDLEKLAKKLTGLYQQLGMAAYFRLTLPRQGNSTGGQESLLAKIRGSVEKERQSYESALKDYKGKPNDGGRPLNELMRIAYDFSDEAVKMIVFLVSLADLKPALLWCTIKEHYDLANAFQNLPWLPSQDKPSLTAYRGMVAGNRNHAFHNLLNFDRSVRADLQGLQLNARELVLFPAYSGQRQREKSPSLDYEDREIVDLLAALTRAPELAVPADFWEKNLEVILAFERLLKATEDALWLMNGVS